MDKHQVFEHLITSDNDKFYFKFIGIPKNDVDLEKIKLVVNKVFNKSILTYDIKSVVSFIRTVFEKFRELELEIELYIKDDILEKIIYKNKVLEFYKKELEEQISIIYNKNNKPNINFGITDLDFDDYFNCKIKGEIINEEINNLYKLLRIDGVSLTDLDKGIILMYKAFFGEYPDFSVKDVNMKIQCMMSILTDFGISLDERYSFKLNSNNMPVSVNLKDDLNRLKPFSMIGPTDYNVKLDELLQRDIKVIGAFVKNYIDDGMDEIENLIRLTKIIYSGKNCLPTNAALEIIADLSNSSTEDVENSLKLMKRINKKIGY